MKLKGMKVTKVYDTTEPMYCQYFNCPEDMNGLNHLWIKPFRGFCFDIWLCEKHYKLFKKKLEALE